jgi:hypothetical protein
MANFSTLTMTIGDDSSPELGPEAGLKGFYPLGSRLNG